MTIAALFLALIATPGDAASSPVAARGEPVLLDFHADWCGPCKAMRPGIAQLVKSGFPVRSIDVDQDRETTRRYGVTSYPTFVVVDPEGNELDRTAGYQPASNLATMYREARAKLAPAAQPGPAAVPVSESREAPADDDPAELEDAPAENRPASRRPVNPKPWETVVRIRMQMSNNAVGVGSGTVIYSDAQQAIILTCAHIFKETGRPTPAPSQYRTPISVDLYDGRLSGPKHNQVNRTETLRGEAIDYDLTNDVGLIRIRPGRVLPASRVVPSHWTPRERMHMITVGCSQGNDPTAWDTRIIRAQAGLQHTSTGKKFSMIECETAPREGRSGGGLYTDDGYVAGVCDFADPQHDHGLYAVPQSIYGLLDRNRLTALYEPAPRDREPGQADRLLAKGDARPKRKGEGSVYRGQSISDDGFNVPPPERLGIKPPVVADLGKAPRWSPPKEQGRAAVAAGLTRDVADEDAPPPPATPAEDIPDLDDRPAPKSTAVKSKWKPVRRSSDSDR